ncbi:MAG: alpha/beta hydrolase [Candidatus Nanopelagicales bacterium]
MTPLVLLHAFPLDSAMYAEVVEALGVEVFTPDLPGFGGLPSLPDEPTLDAYADYVAAWLDAAGVERAIVGGTSMGGYVAMAFCRRFTERVSALALIDTKASADPASAAEGRRTMARRMTDESTTQPLLELVLPKLLGETTKGMSADISARVEGWVRDADPIGAAWAQQAMAARPDSLATLRDVDVPSLVIVGEEDVLAPPIDAGVMAAALTDTELLLIPGVGHLTPIEAPREVASALQRLMHRVDG